MIIKLLLDLIYTVVNVLTVPINIPAFPSEVIGYLDTAFQYIGVGMGILAQYTHINYLMTLFGVIFAIDVGVKLYNLIMFILKKIPMLNIK